MTFTDFINTHNLEDYRSYSWELDGAKYLVEAKSNKDQTLYVINFINNKLQRYVRLFQYGVDEYSIANDYTSKLVYLYKKKAKEEIKNNDSLPKDADEYVKPYAIYSVFTSLISAENTDCESYYLVSDEVFKSGFVVLSCDLDKIDMPEQTKLMNVHDSREYKKVRRSELLKICPYLDNLLKKEVFSYTE